MQNRGKQPRAQTKLSSANKRRQNRKPSKTSRVFIMRWDGCGGEANRTISSIAPGCPTRGACLDLLLKGKELHFTNPTLLFFVRLRSQRPSRKTMKAKSSKFRHVGLELCGSKIYTMDILHACVDNSSSYNFAVGSRPSFFCVTLCPHWLGISSDSETSQSTPSPSHRFVSAALRIIPQVPIC